MDLAWLLKLGGDELGVAGAKNVLLNFGGGVLRLAEGRNDLR